VTVGVLDGRVAIESDNSNKCEAILDDEPFAAGKTKKVYHVSHLFDQFTGTD
jgi:hypothetical protein